MTQILKVRACDVVWDNRETNDSYAQQYTYYYENVVKDRNSLTFVEHNEVTRLQVCLALMRMEDELDYFIVEFDTQDRKSYITLDIPANRKLGSEAKTVHIPLYKIFVNPSESDPFVHYDANRNLISLPILPVLLNKDFLVSYGLDIPPDSYIGEMWKNNVVKDMLYQEDGSLVYDNRKELDLSGYTTLSKNWNYEAMQDIEDESQPVYITDENGERRGRMFEICMLKTSDILLADVNLDENTYKVYKQTSGLEECFNVKFKHEVQLVYITAPTDTFAFYIGGDGGEEIFLPLLLRQKYFENRKDMKNMVVATINKSVYLPITLVSKNCVALLAKLGKNWSDKDLEDIGLSPYLDWTEDRRNMVANKVLATYQECVDEHKMSTSYSEIAANYLKEYLLGLGVNYFPLNMGELLKDIEVRCLEKERLTYLDSLCEGSKSFEASIILEEDDETVIQF